MLKACSHVCALRSYPCKWIRYSKHPQETNISKISLTSNSSSPSILTNGNGRICFPRMVDETWDIKWIFINLRSYNQNELHFFLIILRIEHAPEGHLEVIFEGCSTNENAIVFSWSSVEGVGYYCWLWRSLNDLPQEQQLFYVLKIMWHIFDFY